MAHTRGLMWRNCPSPFVSRLRLGPRSAALHCMVDPSVRIDTVRGHPRRFRIAPPPCEARAQGPRMATTLATQGVDVAIEVATWPTSDEEAQTC